MLIANQDSDDQAPRLAQQAFDQVGATERKQAGLGTGNLIITETQPRWKNAASGSRLQDTT
jgi:hypothetical protein